MVALDAAAAPAHNRRRSGAVSNLFRIRDSRSAELATRGDVATITVPPGILPAHLTHERGPTTLFYQSWKCLAGGMRWRLTPAEYRIARRGKASLAFFLQGDAFLIPWTSRGLLVTEVTRPSGREQVAAARAHALWEAFAECQIRGSRRHELDRRRSSWYSCPRRLRSVGR